jgi:hypothetical protein
MAQLMSVVWPSLQDMTAVSYCMILNFVFYICDEKIKYYGMEQSVSEFNMVSDFFPTLIMYYFSSKIYEIIRMCQRYFKIE